MCGKGLGSDVGQDPELVALYTAAVKKGTRFARSCKNDPEYRSYGNTGDCRNKSRRTGNCRNKYGQKHNGTDLRLQKTADGCIGRECRIVYSGKAVKPIALRFISDMKHNAELKDIPISGMGGIETWHDAAEFMALAAAMFS